MNTVRKNNFFILGVCIQLVLFFGKNFIPYINFVSRILEHIEKKVFTLCDGYRTNAICAPDGFNPISLFFLFLWVFMFFGFFPLLGFFLDKKLQKMRQK